MKALIVLGAIVGFLTAATCGLVGNSPMPTTLWRACAAALAAAILTRWWSSVWVKSLQDSLEQRNQAQPANTKPAAKT